VHGRFSGFGAPVNWIAADIVRIEAGVLAEHWDVIQDEAAEDRNTSRGTLDPACRTLGGPWDRRYRRRRSEV
jgi:hypothetical protein